MEVAKRHQDQLTRIKETVKQAYENYRHNYERFNEFRSFIFDTSLTDDDVTLLTTISKPQLEFNITEAYISRLMGEFSKQEPSIIVSAEDQDKADPTTIHVVEQYIRYMLMDTNNHHTKYEVYKDIISGGFSSFKIWTDYKNSMSFDQELHVDRVYDPTLVGYDPLARYSHKGDGRYCFELFPMSKDTFEQDFPDIDISRLKFNQSFAGFNWAYLNGSVEIVLVCDYYEKKKRNIKIVQLVDGRVMSQKEYDKLLQSWNSIMQPPAIKGKSRWTNIETIVRYRCIDNQVIEYSETDFTMFPLIFVDGNSIMIKNPKTSSTVRQLTRPYVYHAKGAQKLKNFAGITLANEIENIVQHKIMVAKEALPKEEDWLQAYVDIQKPSTYVFNAFFEQDPDKAIPNPIREVQRVPTPPEVSQTFQATDSLIQNILGSYDAALGINDNQLSGVAIVEAATQSNAAAMPYVVSFLQGLQRVAEFLVDIIPKYIVTPRTVPIMGIDGKRDYVKVNQPNGVNLNYDQNVLNVKVEAGVSFQIQKSRALNQIIALMQASPLFAQFMNEKGLPVLLDNIEIRGIDQLKLMVDEWMQEMAQQKAMAMQQQQQQMQNNPLVMKNQIEMQKLQQAAQKNQGQFAVDMAKIKADQMKALSDALIAKNSNEVQALKAQTEQFAKEVELKVKMTDQAHRHAKESLELHHAHERHKREMRNEQSQTPQY